jgi:hypothetical protein
MVVIQFTVYILYFKFYLFIYLYNQRQILYEAYLPEVSDLLIILTT